MVPLCIQISILFRSPFLGEFILKCKFIRHFASLDSLESPGYPDFSFKVFMFPREAALLEMVLTVVSPSGSGAFGHIPFAAVVAAIAVAAIQDETIIEVSPPVCSTLVHIPFLNQVLQIS